MTVKFSFYLLLLLVCQTVLAQRDTIVLQEVVISDASLKTFSDSKTVFAINDSILRKSNPSLTSLLNYNSTVYFKENGLGMVSSPSFRGTTAQQTAVVWNGININSQLNGQTDFNTINSASYQSVAVRAGGGSVIYGTGAIGGSIHLNNAITFDKEFSNQLNLRYGSFATIHAEYALKAATDKTSAQFSVSRNSSENDYNYPGTEKYNENGQFQNLNFNLGFGYKIDKTNVLRLYSEVFDGSRNFSGTLAAPSKSNYRDTNTRNLLEWASTYSKAISTFRLAFLNESYKYFEDKDQPNFTFGKSETALAKYDLHYKLTERILLKPVISYARIKGFGSDITENVREVFSGAFLLKHQISKSFLYEAGISQETVSDYKSPLLYSIGMHFQPLDWYALKFSFSKNFRIPTYNDLYWNPGGNENLKPESALQFDLTQEVKFKAIRFSVSGFYNKITDMIAWTPNSSGFWQPLNTNKVRTYGIETSLGLDKKIGQSHHLEIRLNYAYTVSENETTKKQLMYVPYHKLVSNLAYNYKKITIHATALFNGAVFTSLGNDNFLKEYTIVNAGLDYQLVKFASLGFQVQNVFDESYQVVLPRPFPGRNYNINLNLNL